MPHPLALNFNLVTGEPRFTKVTHEFGCPTPDTFEVCDIQTRLSPHRWIGWALQGGSSWAPKLTSHFGKSWPLVYPSGDAPQHSPDLLPLTGQEMEAESH